jgi:signal recognition particle subunit SRP54
MGKNKGMMQRMAGAFGLGGGAVPNAAEIERMQAELGRLDPKALEQLPNDVREQLGAGGGPAPSLPGLGGKAVPRLPGLPGLGGGGQRFTGLPGLPGKKR